MQSSSERLGLRERVTLISGAASGIGRAIALRLGEEGACVCILDLDGAGAERVAEEIRRAGGRAAARRVDICDAASVEGAVAEFEAECGAIDGLVNNAGWDVAGAGATWSHRLRHRRIGECAGNRAQECGCAGAGCRYLAV